MPLKERYSFENLINEAERMVLQELEKQIDAPENTGVCFCQECILDMTALALNTVKPFYRVSLLGSLYAHVIDDSEYAVQIHEAVIAAIGKIQKNPSHD